MLPNVLVKLRFDKELSLIHIFQFWECQLKPSVRNENLNGLLFTLNHLFLENFAVRHAVLYGEGSRDLNLIAAEDKTEDVYKRQVQHSTHAVTLAIGHPVLIYKEFFTVRRVDEAVARCV